MRNKEELENALSHLESQRAILGDATVDAAIAGIQMQIAALDEEAKSEDQRKQVTVLFADVSGFTAMSENLDAEDVQETMNALWGEVDKVILNHNGRIDKHIGDAVMALWGTEEAREDDPELAIQAALAMQTAVQSFAAKRRVPLKMRVGLNTGLVVLGEVGTTAEFTAMGDTVNIASRLEHAAPIGGILISHDTYSHVRGVFEVEALEPLMVKGKTAPLHVYVVKQAKPRSFRMGRRGLEGLETKTIGREQELERLFSNYKAAISQPQTTVVTVVGEAGVGKSRLLFEFENWMDLRPELIRYFKGRAFYQTRSVPFYLLRELLADRFQILDSDTLTIVKEKFVAGVSRFLSEDGEMKAHFLGTWLGYDFSDSPYVKSAQDEPEQIKNRATLYLAQYFVEVCQESPAVILLEDIHWADSISLNTVVDLVRRQPQLPLLIVCLTRPSFYEQRPAWGNRFYGHNRLDLTPLSGENIRALIKELLRLINPLPELLLDLISNRAEGNPFYAEELVKMLIDDGVILAEGENWRVMSEQLLDLKVPSTLTGVLQARLDKLKPAEKQAIQQASVIGRVFWDGALAALPHESHRTLPNLQAKEFVYNRTESAFAGTTEYIFKHALLQDVTYETVLKRLRRKYHALVADWLVAAAELNDRSDEYAALIGNHYQLANELQSAAFWYERAGQQAASSFSYDEAIRYFNFALDFTADDDHTIRFALLAARENVHDMQGNREAQHKDLVQLESLISHLDVIEQARFALRQSRYAFVISDYENAIHYAEIAIQKGKQADNLTLMARGHWVLGNILSLQGKYLSAQENFQASLQLSKEEGDQKQMANSINGLGAVTFYQGEYDKTKEHYEQVLALRRKIHDLQGEGASLNNLGVLAVNQGDFVAARAYYEQSLQIKRVIGDRRGEAVNLNNLGVVAMNQGDCDGARSYYEQSLVINQEIGDRRGEGVSLLNSGNAAMNQGDLTAAKEYVESALEIMHETGNRLIQGLCQNALGAFALTESNLGDAENYYKKALSIRQELNLPHYLVEDWAGMARLKLAQNNLDDARYFVQLVLEYLKENPRLHGAEKPMRAFNYTWNVLISLGQSNDAENVLKIASQIIQDYLENNPDPALQEMYLSQPHHQMLWNAWQDTTLF